MPNTQPSKTVHIVGAGGNAGQLAYRCLKDHYKITGHDSSQWGELIMPCEYDEPWNADCILPLPDKAVASRYGDSDLSFTPDQKQIALCQDKAECSEVLGDLAPKTYWVRETIGAGGKGAQMASEYLPGRNVSVEVAFWNDSLIGSIMKERLAYSISGSKEPTHQFGTSFVSKCIADIKIAGMAEKALLKIRKHTNTPIHGFYGIDFKENKGGQFKITEINAGRLLTASYCYYYLTDYNLLRAGVARFLGDKYELGEYPLNYGIIRGLDMPPRLFSPEDTKGWK
jgi:hypothetical protein